MASELAPLDRKVLRRDVREIVSTGDLDQLTSKIVRQQLEEKWGNEPGSLKPHKAQIEEAVLKALAKLREKEEDEGENEDSQRAPERKRSKAAAHDHGSSSKQKAEKKPAAVKKTASQEAEEARLRKIIGQVGLQAKTRFKGVREMGASELLEKLGGILIAAVGSTNPSREEIREYKAARERAIELDGIDASNIIGSSKSGGGGAPSADAPRPRRSAARRRTAYNEWDNVGSDGELIFAEEDDDRNDVAGALDDKDEAEPSARRHADAGELGAEEDEAAPKPKARRVVVEDDDD